MYTLPSSVSFQCRHLYYSRGFDEISRINLDGGDIASEVEVVEQRTFDDISGIAVDHSLNLLYWAVNNTNSNVLRYLNMTDWDCAYRRGTQLVSYYKYLHVHVHVRDIVYILLLHVHACTYL